MDQVTGFQERLESSPLRMRELEAAACELATAFAESEVRLRRGDQAAQLRSLGARIEREVQDAVQAEKSSNSASTQVKAISGSVAFVIGGLAGVARGDEEPLNTAINASKTVTGKKEPFGMVLVAVGKQGVPDDVGVSQVSRLARQSQTSESDITENLRAQGYVLTSPEAFASALKKVEAGVLDGTVSLPLPLKEFVRVGLQSKGPWRIPLP